MRIAIFSDVHANRHALDNVLADLEAHWPAAANAIRTSGLPDKFAFDVEHGGAPAPAGTK